MSVMQITAAVLQVLFLKGFTPSCKDELDEPCTHSQQLPRRSLHWYLESFPFSVKTQINISLFPGSCSHHFRGSDFFSG